MSMGGDGVSGSMVGDASGRPQVYTRTRTRAWSSDPARPHTHTRPPAGKHGHVNYATVPSICYTHPEVRGLGLGRASLGQWVPRLGRTVCGGGWLCGSASKTGLLDAGRGGPGRAATRATSSPQGAKASRLLPPYPLPPPPAPKTPGGLCGPDGGGGQGQGPRGQDRQVQLHGQQPRPRSGRHGRHGERSACIVGVKPRSRLAHETPRP